MKHDALKTIFIVLKPSDKSELVGDILRQVTIETLVASANMGLKPDDILAVYPFQQAAEAEQYAKGALEGKKKQLATTKLEKGINELIENAIVSGKVDSSDVSELISRIAGEHGFCVCKKVKQESDRMGS